MPQVNGAEIRERRRRLGLKPAEFALQIRISRSHLVNIELGHKDPAIEVVWRIANIFGIEAGDLMADEPNGTAA